MRSECPELLAEAIVKEKTSAEPELQAPRPALRVGDFARAIEHYVDWLGFRLDSEWREAPGMPAIGFLSRDHFVFMINEHPGAPGPASVHLDVSHLDSLAEEWNQRRPGSVTIRRAPPYEFPEVVIEDPWGNCLFFEGKLEAEEQARRAIVRQQMNAHVERELAAGRGLPTPEGLRDAVGPPLGVAMEVLNAYPEYGALHQARRDAAAESASDD
jgi:catechol 2,3-dioxygenase-like lactoylglutathione lyase family enzyme